MQRFQNATFSDQNLFTTTIVPLTLRLDNRLIWINEMPSSNRFCRPIRLQYLKETVDVLKNEKKYIKDQINSFPEATFESVLHNKIHYEFYLKLTMIDGVFERVSVKLEN